MNTTSSTDPHNHKSFWCTRTALALALGLMTAAAVGLPPSVALAAPAVVIKMQDKPPKYLPEKATIKLGQTVEWVNDAKTLHSVTADPASAQKKGDVKLPPGAKPFDSGFMQPDATYDYTFKVPGTYKYTCLPHEKDGMDGYIVVKK
ncbi:MAG: cupredoxin domain-containing protein [Candidatus Binataceae bacterium]